VANSDVAGRAEREPFRVLPEPVRREDWVETVDTAEHPAAFTDEDERARFLRLAGGGTP
jgi:hypothetical protein